MDELPPKESTIISVNFKEGVITDTIQYEAEGGIPKFFRELAKIARKTKVKSAIVMTIDENNKVDWIDVVDNDYHMSLAALCLEDIKKDLKTNIFGSDEEEE